MKETVEKKLARAIMIMAERITPDINSVDALRFTQAAANMAHTIGTLGNTAKQHKH